MNPGLLRAGLFVAETVAVTAGLVVAVCHGVALVASVLRRRGET